MFKKPGCIFILIIVLIVVAWFKPWEAAGFDWGRLIGLEEIKKYSALTAFSLKDNIEVYIDNEYKNSVDASGGSIEISELEPGIHRVTLIKKAAEGTDYFQFSKTLNFEEGVSNVVAYELGPSQEFSQGHVFYTDKKNELTEDNHTLISFLSNINEIEIYMDNKLIGKSPLEDYSISLKSQYDIKLRKEGYEELSFKILPETDEDRDKLQNLHLYIEANLFLKPIDINKK